MFAGSWWKDVILFPFSKMKRWKDEICYLSVRWKDGIKMKRWKDEIYDEKMKFAALWWNDMKFQNR